MTDLVAGDLVPIPLLPVLHRALGASQRLTAAERTHTAALLAAVERSVLGEATAADEALLAANRVKHGLPA